MAVRLPGALRIRLRKLLLHALALIVRQFQNLLQ